MKGRGPGQNGKHSSEPMIKAIQLKARTRYSMKSKRARGRNWNKFFRRIVRLGVGLSSGEREGKTHCDRPEDLGGTGETGWTLETQMSLGWESQN